MANVELRPGDTLNFVWTSVQPTPFGTQEVESSFQFSYDDLMEKLGAKKGKSRRSGTLGAKFSRLVALSAASIKKGKWSTGAEIDRKEVFDKLMDAFNQLDSREYVNITKNAHESLKDLHKRKQLTPAQKKVLKTALDAVEKAKEAA